MRLLCINTLMYVSLPNLNCLWFIPLHLQTELYAAPVVDVLSRLTSSLCHIWVNINSCLPLSKDGTAFLSASA